nr:PREDICTED: putative methyltransferase NSUN7 isoform X2 [Latimeria chalumnae]|eukprot:XP_014351230.1 PREDICTED: putative methyltransferase NSUN7 isoform X2 [Latimeria chalumnae]
MSLALVLMYVFHDGKFQFPLIPEIKEYREVMEVTRALYNYRTKLAAAFARERIQNNVLSISSLLPDAVRKQEDLIASVPIYTWVNTAKTSIEDVLSSLKLMGLSQTQDILELTDRMFLLDTDCDDVIVFSPNLKDELSNSELFSSHSLVVQDKSRSLAVHCARAETGEGEDVLITNSGSGLTAMHMAALMEKLDGKVFSFDCPLESKETALKQLAKAMEVKKVTFFSDNFLNLNPNDARLQKVRVILMTPMGSASSLGNPLDFILNEDEDVSLIEHLAHGEIPATMITELADRHLAKLAHAMTFPNVRSIVYCTCSVYDQENQEVLTRALQLRNSGSSEELRFRLFPPALWAAEAEDTERPPKPSSNLFLSTDLSPSTNGCFLALLSREVPSAHEILAQAVKKGLLEKSLLYSETQEDDAKATGDSPLTLPKEETAGSLRRGSQTSSGESRKAPPKLKPLSKSLPKTKDPSKKPERQKENKEDASAVSKKHRKKAPPEKRPPKSSSASETSVLLYTSSAAPVPDPRDCPKGLECLAHSENFMPAPESSASFVDAKQVGNFPENPNAKSRGDRVEVFCRLPRELDREQSEQSLGDFATFSKYAEAGINPDNNNNRSALSYSRSASSLGEQDQAKPLLTSSESPQPLRKAYSALQQWEWKKSTVVGSPASGDEESPESEQRPGTGRIRSGLRRRAPRKTQVLHLSQIYLPSPDSTFILGLESNRKVRLEKTIYTRASYSLTHQNQTSQTYQGKESSEEK